MIKQYPPPKMSKSTLLIVDDEPLNLAVLARLLNPHTGSWARVQGPVRWSWYSTRGRT